MRIATLILAVASVLCWSAPGWAQKKRPLTPADLLPASTIGYLEVTQPGELARELRDLLKGSVLHNLPDSLAALEARHPDQNWATMTFKMLGLALAPEVVNEIALGHGAAGAFLGLKRSDQGPAEPEFVFIVQPGASSVATFALRLLMSTPNVRARETVEGVKIYRTLAYQYQLSKVGPNDLDSRPALQQRDGDPSYAMLKDLLLIGSHQAVKDCIWRARGKWNGATLAGDSESQAARKQFGSGPGLFGFTHVSRVLALLSQVAPAGDPEAGRLMEAYARAINPKAFGSTAVSLTLEKGALHYRESTGLQPKEKSPLLEVYPTRAVNTNVLHFAPRDATLAVAISNADGATRFDRLAAILQELTPHQPFDGGGFTEQVKELERQLGVQFGPDILAKTSNIGFALGNPLTAPVTVTRTEFPGNPNFTSETRVPQVPMVLIVETVDRQAAQALQEALVKAGQLRAGNAVKPEAKKINGQSVFSIPLAPGSSLAYGVVGNTVVLGPHADAVAQALADGADRKGLASDAKVVAQLSTFKSPIGVGMLRPSSLVTSVTMLGSFGGRTFKKVAGNLGAPQVTVTTRKRTPEELKESKELLDILALEPWVVLGMTRTENTFVREATSPGWDRFVPRIINYGAQKALEWSRASGEHAPDAEPKAIQEEIRKK